MASALGDRVDRLVAREDGHAVMRLSAARDADAGTDAQFVASALGGDRSAFGSLYDRYARLVHGILLARVPLRDVDDLVHDTFLQALGRLHTLRDPERFGAWLAAIARNRANDYHRDSVEEVELDESMPANAAAGGARSPAIDDETVFLLGAIRRLPETYRETLLLRLVEGMTGPEIAARTGLRPGSVRVNLHRGMEQLRKNLARAGRSPRAASVSLHEQGGKQPRE
jgi:RNA polymerase sigma-70 factor, ECF subfamily